MRNKISLFIFAFLLMIGCSPNRAHNFQVRNVKMQSVIIDGLENDSLDFYKVSVMMEDCNEYYSLMGALSYEGGLIESIQSISVYNYGKENVTSLLKGLQKIEDMPFSTIEVEESSKYSYFCYRCANLDEFKDELNRMTINLRTECNNKEDSTHSVNRIFCFSKGVCPIVKMTIKLQNHSVSCVVDNRPVKLEIKEVFR